MKSFIVLFFLYIVGTLSEGNRPQYHSHRKPIIIFPHARINHQIPIRQQQDITDVILQHGKNKLIDLSDYFTDANSINSDRKGPFLYIKTNGPIKPFTYQQDNKIINFGVDNDRLLNYFIQNDDKQRQIIDHIDPNDKQMQQNFHTAIVQSLTTDSVFTTRLRNKLMARLSIPQQSKMVLDPKEINETFSNVQDVKHISQKMVDKLL